MSDIIFDLETNAIGHGGVKSIHTIWCAAVRRLGTEATLPIRPEQVKDVPAMLEEADRLIGHNIVPFDVPVVEHLYPKFKRPANILDTLVLSRICYPDIKNTTDFDLFRKGVLPGKLIGRHSLEAWGYRLGLRKGEYGKQEECWDRFTEEMLEYCVLDVDVNHLLYEHLQQFDIPEHVLADEHEIAEILKRQEDKGFLFDKKKAELLYADLLEKKASLTDTLNDKKAFGPFWLNIGWFTPKRDNAKLGYKKGKTVMKKKFVDFNPGSNDHIAYWLHHKYGWEPLETTKTGKPKINEEELKRLAKLDYPEAAPLIDYLVVKKRLGQLGDGKNAWLKLVEEDSRLHGYVNGIGCQTFRMSHSSPNMAQVPATRKLYGHECRELFTVPEGWTLVGIDASGLELRCLAHYLKPFEKRGELCYADKILETDIHTTNQIALGIAERDPAKTWIYAWLYGAGDAKLSKILGTSIQEARTARGSFLRQIPSIPRLTKAILATLAGRDYLRGLDGRAMPVRRKSAALNTLLQGAGAIVMKKACILLDRSLRAHAIPAYFVGNIHDEWQMEVKSGYEHAVGELGVQAIRQAGIELKFNMPLDGEFKMGYNWAETH